MDIELFVHGVPSGEDFWGKDEERNYCGQFYNKSTDEVKFFIQTRLLNGKPYCYYNYLVYKSVGAQSPNIVANDGRDGSYFGLTLRLDAYCKDIFNIYRILDTIFNVYVMGSVLKVDKAKLKYAISDFSSVSTTWQKIETATMDLIKSAFSNDSFVLLAGFALTGSNYKKNNLFDCTPEYVMETVKQSNCIAISPYYPSRKEAAIQQQCNDKIQEVQQQCKAQVKATADAYDKEKEKITTSYATIKKQNSQHQREIEQQDETIKQLRADVSRLKAANQKMEHSKTIAQVIEPIREPIVQLGGLLKQIYPDTAKRKDDKSKLTTHYDKETSVFSLLKPFIPFINLLLLLVVTITILNPFKKETNGVSDEVLQNKIELLERQNQELQEQLQIERTSGTGTEPEHGPAASKQGFDINQVWIDVDGYSGGNLSIGKTYKVTAKRGIESGTWDGKGCDITTNPTDSNVVTVKPTAKDVTIIYKVNGQQKERKLTAQ